MLILLFQLIFPTDLIFQARAASPNVPTLNNLNDGGSISDTTPTFNFDLSDPDSGDSLRYKLEVDEAGGNFSTPLLSETESGTEREYVSLASGGHHTVALK
jgi:hypothetical protein